MTAYSKLAGDPLYVVCGDHEVRYPAACLACPLCPGLEGRMRNPSHDPPMPVDVVRR